MTAPLITDITTLELYGRATYTPLMTSKYNIWIRSRKAIGTLLVVGYEPHPNTLLTYIPLSLPSIVLQFSYTPVYCK